MKKPTLEELKKIYANLPQKVKDVYFGVDTAEIIQEIGKKHKLMLDKTGELADEVGSILIGLTHPKDFVSNLSLRLGIDKIKAREIADEVNEKVFQKIREDLRKMHNISDSTKSEMPEAGIKNNELEKKPEIEVPKSEPTATPASQEPSEKLPAKYEEKSVLIIPEPKIEASPFEHKLEGDEIFKSPKEVSAHEAPEKEEGEVNNKLAEKQTEAPKTKTAYSDIKDPYREPVE